MLRDPILSDDLVIRLIQAHYAHNKKIDALEQVGIELTALRIEILPIALDAVGVPPEDGFDNDLLRDWIYTIYAETVENGSYEEIQQFLTEVRAGLKERGLEDSGE